MRSRWIKWSQWDHSGRIAGGTMPLHYLEKHLREFGRKAEKLMNDVGADHVVYGMKRYGENGLEEVRFYMEAMDEERFQKAIATMTDAVVYALHRIGLKEETI